MATFTRQADAIWEGNLKEGSGSVKAATGAFSLPVTFPSRVEDPHGRTSPEELIAAAHAACYAMALTATMGRKNVSARRLHVSAVVGAEFANGIRIQTSHLAVTAEGLQGMDLSAFAELAREAEGGCPVSNALRATLKIDVEAKATA
jgi:osmotically inducible protein OsmC